jgi:hypothetical protein
MERLDLTHESLAQWRLWIVFGTYKDRQESRFEILPGSF